MDVLILECGRSVGAGSSHRPSTRIAQGPTSEVSSSPSFSLAFRKYKYKYIYVSSLLLCPRLSRLFSFHPV